MTSPKITNCNFDKIFNKFTCNVFQVIDKHALVKFFLQAKEIALKAVDH